MALTYDESQALMNDFQFRGRIKVALLKYSDSVISAPGGTPFHNTELRYAQSVYSNPDQQAAQIQPPVVMDTQVQTDGKNITDDALQVSVETVAKKLM